MGYGSPAVACAAAGLSGLHVTFSIPVRHYGQSPDRTMQAVTDEQLIGWVADGDASCLGTLFERHHRDVYRFCLQMTRNKTMSEDLVQEVFLRVLKRASTFRGD